MINRFKYALAALLIILTLPACNMKEAAGKLSIELRQVKVKNFTNAGFEAMALMEVKNANGFGLKVADMSYTVLVEGREVATGRMQREVDIPANGSAVAELPFHVGADGFGVLLQNALKGKLNYRLKGEVVFRTFLGRYTVPFDKEKKG